MQSMFIVRVSSRLILYVFRAERLAQIDTGNWVCVCARSKLITSLPTHTYTLHLRQIYFELLLYFCLVLRHISFECCCAALRRKRV